MIYRGFQALVKMQGCLTWLTNPESPYFYWFREQVEKFGYFGVEYVGWMN
ncbi:MAG: hypothetical protein GX896_05970 [Clostridiales bacterium]|nr:hypothetical protein [Clostridiales bacterium]